MTLPRDARLPNAHLSQVVQTLDDIRAPTNCSFRTGLFGSVSTVRVPPHLCLLAMRSRTRPNVLP